MKKQIGVLLAAFLILLLGWAILPAPAVPSDDPPEENIAGSDWRTWGIIDDSGTLGRTGRPSPSAPASTPGTRPSTMTPKVRCCWQS